VTEIKVTTIIHNLRDETMMNIYSEKDRLIPSKLYQSLKSRKSCELCKKKRAKYEFLQIHHKIPISMGGTNERANLLVLCSDCHKKAHGEMNDVSR
jgi:5-methylcytosine-specific restriction endonuclease McrA